MEPSANLTLHGCYIQTGIPHTISIKITPKEKTSIDHECELFNSVSALVSAVVEHTDWSMYSKISGGMYSGVYSVIRFKLLW